MSKKYKFELTGLQLSALTQLFTATRNSFKEDKDNDDYCRMVLDVDNVVLGMSKKEFNALKSAILKIRSY